MKIWVVDDHSIIRQGLKRILEENSHEFQVTAEAASAQELNELFTNKPLPEALILDLSMPGKTALEIIPDIRKNHPDLPILVLSMHAEDQYALRSFKVGASGYLSKSCTGEELVKALKVILRGEKYITSHVTKLLAQNLSEASTLENPHESLSDREFQIMIFIAQGVSLTEIAQKFYLSVKTVSTYRTRVLKKMGMRTNADLVHYCLSHKLLNV